MRALTTALITACFVFPDFAAAATIQVNVVDNAGKPVRDAVVYAVPPTSIPVGRKVAVMDQMDRTFVPHVLPVQTGTWVEFPNSDNIRHTVYSVSPARRFQLPLYIGKPAFPIQFPNAGVVSLGCNIHEQMSAFIIVVDTPHFAKIEEGPASITDVAPGQYTLKVWYPRMRKEPAAKTLMVGAADPAPVTFVTP